jgi:hypothetical protein
MKTSWMKLVLAAVVAVALAGASSSYAAGAAKAGAKKGQRAQALRGRIVSVNGKAGNVKLVVHSGGKKNPHDVTVQADLDTKVTLDGMAALASDLKPGERVTVTPASGTAKTIVATGKAAKAKGEGKAARAKTTHAKPARA